MKYRYALLPILLLALIVAPAFAFWHPPPPPDEHPPCTYFGVLVNGKFGTVTNPVVFQEPTDNYCDYFKVEVFIANVTDLYGYYFELGWNAVYYSLVNYTVEATWPSQFVVKPAASYAKTSPYVQAVSAVAPSTGVTGDFKLATLWFHIDNDVCWLQQPFICTWFDLMNEKASNSCAGEIRLCEEMDAAVKFIPVKPKITLTPEHEINSKVGDKFTLTVTLENIVKLTDFDLTVAWHGFNFKDEPAVWTALLCTTKADVVINTDVFPAANSTQTITVISPPCDVRYGADPVGSVHVVVVMNPTYPLINGTFWLFKITFTKCDPWFCGAQPEYTPKGDHDWKLENATTPICITGALSVKCPNPANMYLPNDVTVVNARFTFLPIPGDLDGSGHVDITDIMIEAGYYGYEMVEAWPGLPPKYITFYYDLNNDHVIDIYDIVIVAKNFCRTEPDP